MRHLGSLALSLLLTPGIWVLSGIGTVTFTESWQSAGSGYLATAAGLGALLAAGAAYALLVLARLSPVGPGLAGFALLAAGIWAAVDRASFVGIVPVEVLGTSGYRPAAFAPLVAVPLLLTLASPRRWRRYGGPAPAASPVYPGYPPRSPYQGPPAAAPAPPDDDTTTPIYPLPAAPPSWPPDPDQTRRI